MRTEKDNYLKSEDMVTFRLCEAEQGIKAKWSLPCQTCLRDAIHLYIRFDSAAIEGNFLIKSGQ